MSVGGKRFLITRDAEEFSLEESLALVLFGCKTTHNRSLEIYLGEIC